MNAAPRDERIALWRPAADVGLLCIRGVTNGYAVDPRGEVVIGLVTAGGMRGRRGRAVHRVGAGDLCVWGSSDPHAGVPDGCTHWSARLVVLEPAVLERDDDGSWSAGQRFAFARRDPVVRNASIAVRFRALHDALAARPSALEAESLVCEWLPALGDAPPALPSGENARRDAGLLRARALLADNPERNVTLRELAHVAGTDRHRLTRLFRAAYGLPPHHFQIAARVRLARRCLERGMPLAEVASRVGFVDQSHLHRHFRRTLGITPAQYARVLRSNVQDARGAGL